MSTEQSELQAEIDALIGKQSNDWEYASFNDNTDTQTHLTIASMLKDQDKNNLVKIAVFLCGMGSFLTFMVTAASPAYIQIAYPSQPNALYLLVSIYNTANMIGLLIMLSPAGSYISIAVRIQYGYILTSLVTFFIPFIPYLFDFPLKLTIFIWVNGVISGLSSALLVTSLFSFAAILPNEYLISAVSGQSVAGILSALIRIINKAAFDTNTHGTILSGIGTFAMAGVIQLLAALIFSAAVKSQFVDEYMFQYWALRYSKYLDHNNSNKDAAAERTMATTKHKHDYSYASHLHGDFVNPATATNGGTAAASSTNGVPRSDDEIEMSIKTAVSELHELVNKNPATEESIERHLSFSKKETWNRKMSHCQTIDKQNTNYDYFIVIKKIYKCLLSIFIGYGATYLVFPSLMVGLELNNDTLMDSKWSGVVLYLIWSGFGWIGIFFAKFEKFYCRTTYNNLWILQFLWMCVMYVLFIIANEKVITNDIYIYGIVAVSPLLFGFFSARTFAELPSRVGVYETEIAQRITQFTLLAGILIGAWIAFGMETILF